LAKLDQTRLEDKIARLEALVADQAKRLRALEGDRPEGEGSRSPGAKAPTRRELLRLAGAAVVGAAGVAGAGVLDATPVAAAEGGNLVLGNGANNLSETVTILRSDATITPTGLLTLDGVSATGTQRIDGLTVLSQEGGIAGIFNAALGPGAIGPDVYLSGSGRLTQAVATGGVIAVVPLRVINVDPAIGPVGGGVTWALVQGTTQPWTIAGAHGIPTDAVGIVGNITVVAYTSGGFLTMFPTGVTQPVVSSLNFAQPGTVFAWGNHFTVGFGTGADAGKISIYFGLNAPGDTCHVVVDVFGFLQ
jgi:hypothetical protein